MNSKEFHLNYLELTDDKVAAIKGTDGDDFIALQCFDYIDKCTLTINGNSHSFLKDDLIVANLKINSGEGNDSISVIVPKGMVIQRTQIHPGEGNNKIYTKLYSPYSSAELNLGYGSNTISFEPTGSNIFIFGFKNSPNNKIQIRDQKLTLEDIIIKRDDKTCETYKVYLKSSDNPVNKYYLCDIYNSLTPAEYDAYAILQGFVEEGRKIPPEYQSMAYVLDGPKNLESEILNSNNFVFSIE